MVVQIIQLQNKKLSLSGGVPWERLRQDFFVLVSRIPPLQRICTFLQENGFLPHMSKLVGFGCDGASNMFGKKNGLVTLLKRDHPEVITIHCLAHRLELVFKDTFKRDKMFLKLTTLLLGLFSFYKNSAKQRKKN